MSGVCDQCREEPDCGLDLCIACGQEVCERCMKRGYEVCYACDSDPDRPQKLKRERKRRDLEHRACAHLTDEQLASAGLIARGIAAIEMMGVWQSLLADALEKSDWELVRRTTERMEIALEQFPEGKFPAHWQAALDAARKAVGK